MTATWDPSNKSAGITLSGSDLVATIASGTSNVAATRACSGKTYFEVTVGASLTGTLAVGICNRAFSMSAGTTLGANANGCGWRQNGTVVIVGSTIATIATFAATNTLCVAVDPAAQLIWFRVGAGNWNNNAANDPATGTGGISLATMILGPVLPAMGGTTVTPNMSGTAAFASGSFAQAVPSGYDTVDTIQVAARRTLAGNESARSHALAAASFRSIMPAAAGAWYGGTTGSIGYWAPAAAPTHLSGVVTEGGVPVAKVVRLYDRRTGLFLGEAVSDAGDGSYEIPALGRAAVVAIAFNGPAYNALVYDNVAPV